MRKTIIVRTETGKNPLDQDMSNAKLIRMLKTIAMLDPADEVELQFVYSQKDFVLQNYEDRIKSVASAFKMACVAIQRELKNKKSTLELESKILQSKIESLSHHPDLKYEDLVKSILEIDAAISLLVDEIIELNAATGFVYKNESNENVKHVGLIEQLENGALQAVNGVQPKVGKKAVQDYQKILDELLLSVHKLLARFLEPQDKNDKRHTVQLGFKPIVLLAKADEYVVLTKPRPILATLMPFDEKWYVQMESPCPPLSEVMAEEYLAAKRGPIEVRPDWYRVMQSEEKALFDLAMSSVHNKADVMRLIEAIPSRLRTIPGVPNFSVSLRVVCDASGLQTHVFQPEWRSSNLAPRDLLKSQLKSQIDGKKITEAEVNALCLRVTKQNMLQVIAMYGLVKSRLSKSMHKIGDQSAVVKSPVLLFQTLISPLTVTSPFKPDHDVYEYKLAAMASINPADFRVPSPSLEQVVVNFESKIELNHPLNIAGKIISPRVNIEELVKLYDLVCRFYLENINKKNINLKMAYQAACDIRDLMDNTSFKTRLMSSGALHLHLLALEGVAVSQIGGLYHACCISGKDRLAILKMYISSLQLTFLQTGCLYQFHDKREDIAKVFLTNFMNSYKTHHHQYNAHQNAPGSGGIKTMMQYLPETILRAIREFLLDEEKKKDNIRKIIALIDAEIAGLRQQMEAEVQRTQHHQDVLDGFENHIAALEASKQVYMEQINVIEQQNPATGVDPFWLSNRLASNNDYSKMLKEILNKNKGSEMSVRHYLEGRLEASRSLYYSGAQKALAEFIEMLFLTIEDKLFRHYLGVGIIGERGKTPAGFKAMRLLTKSDDWHCISPGEQFKRLDAIAVEKVEKPDADRAKFTNEFYTIIHNVAVMFANGELPADYNQCTAFLKSHSARLIDIWSRIKQFLAGDDKKIQNALAAFIASLYGFISDDNFINKLGVGFGGFRKITPSGIVELNKLKRLDNWSAMRASDKILRMDVIAFNKCKSRDSDRAPFVSKLYEIIHDVALKSKAGEFSNDNIDSILNAYTDELALLRANSLRPGQGAVARLLSSQSFLVAPRPTSVSKEVTVHTNGNGVHP